MSDSWPLPVRDVELHPIVEPGMWDEEIALHLAQWQPLVNAEDAALQALIRWHEQRHI